MSATWERALLLAPPAITVVVIALGLRIGASHEARAARVYGAPPSTARRGLAWTVAVEREDRGVSEPVPGEPLVAQAQMGADRTAHWEGSTNADGVAEAWLALEGAAPGDRVDLSVSSKRDGAVLARGKATVPPAHELRDISDRRLPFLAASRQDGAIRLDVFVVDRALAAEFPSRALIQAKDAHSGARLGGVRIVVEPEPGLEAAPQSVVTCEAGWAELSLTARAHVVGASLHAQMAASVTDAARVGDWFGAIPVAGGALFVPMPTVLPADSSREMAVHSPTPQSRAYVEIDDAQGRAFARAVDLLPDETGMRSARFEVPALLPGNDFLVVSSDPRGAEKPAGATLVYPFLVARPAANASEACGDLQHLVEGIENKEPAGFPRPLVLDGLVPVHALAAQARHRGLRLALGTVLLAALVEALLLLRQAKRGRTALRALPPQIVEGRAGTVAVGLGIALLGFALLAALLLRSSS